jgi:hypothetical protein
LAARAGRRDRADDPRLARKPTRGRLRVGVQYQDSGVGEEEEVEEVEEEGDACNVRAVIAYQIVSVCV